MWPAKSTERLPPQSPLDKHESVQGAQFTAAAFTDVLKAHGVAISMDGKGRWLDNVFVERLWRSEPRRDSRRLQTLRGWSHEQSNKIFARSSGTSGSNGV